MHKQLLSTLCLLLVFAPIFAGSAQDLTVDSTFQTLTLSTTPGFVTGGTCTANLQTPPAASGTVFDAGDFWMECPSYSVALPQSASLTLHSTSGASTLSGTYASLNAESTNGSLNITDAIVESSGVSCSNNPFSITRSSLKNGAVISVNQPVHLTQVVIGTNFNLTNSGLTGRQVTVPKGKRLRIRGTNSDINFRTLRCGPASADLSKAPYRTLVVPRLVRRVTRLNGRADLYRIIRDEQNRVRYVWCASLTISLTNGTFQAK